MSYRVDYQPVKKGSSKKRSASRILILTAACLLVFMLLVNSFWPKGAEVLRNFLLPGDASVTAAALEDLSLELRNGEKLFSALESFCRKVMENAGFGTG